MCGNSQRDAMIETSPCSVHRSVRCRASDKYPVNIGFDFAVGKRSSAYYFRIGEAF
jgi:hypothetical protein